MSNFVIIPDSSCDLPAELRKRFGVDDYLRGILYHPDGREEVVNMDWETTTPEEYYNSMKDKNAIYKTAYAPSGKVMEMFEKYLKQGKDVLNISLSSALSGTYQSCCLVAKELQAKYPERKIICIDSMRYSTALSIIVMIACQKRNEGATIEEVAEYINNIKHRVHQMGPMDDLFFLVKTGRISNFKAFFGTLVGVNPMADFNRNGIAEVLIKVKGKASAFDATIRYMKETIESPQEQIIFVAHSNRQPQAEKLAEMIKKEFNPKEVIINPVGLSCGASIGPGLCAAFYIGKELSENLTEEKAIMAEIEKTIKRR